MLFNSLMFIGGFLPITLLAFFCLGQLGYRRGAIAVLVAASLVFYSWWNPAYLSLLLLSIIFNYSLGGHLSNLTSHDTISLKRGLLGVGILFNLGLLGYFKYAKFFVVSVNNLIGSQWTPPDILLPLAISFFTFQQISYLADAYKAKTKEYSFLDYCLFVTFFPQLIAGPIVHHKEMMPQFASKHIYRFNAEDFTVGLTIFCVGLFKKVVIADSVAPLANGVFAAAAQGDALTFYDGWSGALFYTFQLYFDFSGYSEMALGAARLFGITLPLNFNSPYKAIDISDFWRRWHITLSNFLRDYVYIPLGGNRYGDIRKAVNLLLTMLLGGLWHGAGWTFVLWGGLHGVYLATNHIWRMLQHRLLGTTLDKKYGYSKIPAQLLTFGLVVLAWVLFRADTFTSAVSIWKAMAGFNGFAVSSSIVPLRKKLLIGLCLGVWLLPNLQTWMHQYKPALQLPPVQSNRGWQWLQWKPNMAFGVIIAGLVFLTVKVSLQLPTSEFLYFNF